jgi:pimeloyl-ACP methyl ester carboxylesterase
MGLSDRPPHVDVEEWVEDTGVVLDAVGSEQAALLGVTAGGLISILFAATYPDRVRALVLYGGFARQLRDDHDYPIGLRPGESWWDNNPTPWSWSLPMVRRWVDERAPSASGDERENGDNACPRLLGSRPSRSTEEVAGSGYRVHPGSRMGPAPLR